MKYVVTGGAGFIGSALTRLLTAQPEAQVTVIDDLSAGKRANLEGVECTLAEADIRSYDAIAPLIAGADACFHLAAIPSVPRSILDPIPSHTSNIDGTFEVFRACADAKVRRVVYAASSSAYGDSEVLPKTESMLPRPKSPYAVQKLVGEYYAAVFQECFGLEAISLRFFNVFGPRQDPSSPYSGVLSIFLRCLIERRSPTIYGDGEQTRDFTFVEDVARLCWKASQAPSSMTGNVYNAGNGKRYSLNETWKLIQQIEGVDIPALYGDAREGDILHSLADTTLAVSQLGHSPEVSFEEGLRRTLEWYRANNS